MDTAGPQPWFFDAWSWIYDAPAVQRRAYWPIHDAVLRAVGTQPASLLDLGCGTGQLAARLAAQWPRARVVGCDFSAGMLHRAAAARPAHLRLVQGDAGRLPFVAAAFDVVVCTEAFHWFPTPDEALAECFRVLRPGGRLLLAVTTPPGPVAGRIIDLGSRLLGEPFHWPSRDEARRRLAAVGFRVERQERVSRFGAALLPPILTVAVRPVRRHTPSVHVARASARSDGRALHAPRQAHPPARRRAAPRDRRADH
jgi:ubiquinone/menaquinone biosynthesis C-methylase UbiE